MVYQNQVKTEAYYDIIGTKNSQGMVNMKFSLMLPQEAKNGPFQGQKGEGWPSPSWDFKAPSLPLKSLKISVVRRPKHNDPGAQPKWHKMEPFKA